MAVSDADRDYAGKHIEIFATSFVIEKLTATLHEMWRLGVHLLDAREEIFVTFLLQFFSIECRRHAEILLESDFALILNAMPDSQPFPHDRIERFVRQPIGMSALRISPRASGTSVGQLAA